LRTIDFQYDRFIAAHGVTWDDSSDPQVVERSFRVQPRPQPAEAPE